MNFHMDFIYYTEDASGFRKTWDINQLQGCQLSIDLSELDQFNPITNNPERQKFLQKWKQQNQKLMTLLPH